METNLIKYLPYEVRKYRDFQVIVESENPEFNRIYSISEMLLNETFIMTAGEYGISRLESILNIIPNIDDSLEDRRLRILSRWNNEIPYTWRVLIQKLNSICGVGNYTVELNNDKYIIKLDTKMNTQSQYDDLLFLLNRILPVNLVIQSSNTLSDNLDGNMFIGITMLDSKSYTITNDIVGTQNIDYGYRYGTGISQYSADVIE